MSTFPVTRWTLIVAAGQQGNSATDEALAELCRAYWYPIYAFIRRRGNSPDEAEDLTQGFFAAFLERRNVVLHADPAKGRFRSFLLTSVKHFLADQSDLRNSHKRGGGQTAAPLDLLDAEGRYARKFADNETPERLFDREWALTLLARVDDDVRAVLARENRVGHFEHLKPFLPFCDEEASYTEVAAQLGSSEGALKVAVHRLRRRYREVFRHEIAHLVSDPNLIEDEIRYLLQVLRT
jgi:RNA polymerase sigma factor (sigma-70 family)